MSHTDKYAELVRAIRLLLEKATPYPWYCDSGSTSWPVSVAAGGIRGSRTFRRIALCGSPRIYKSTVDKEHEANGLLISLSPEYMDKAAAAITELQARVRELEEDLAFVKSQKEELLEMAKLAGGMIKYGPSGEIRRNALREAQQDDTSSEM